MSLFEGSAPDPVELSKTTETKVPDYLTNYLTALSEAGMSALGTVKTGADGTKTVTPYTKDELVADLPDFYKTLMTPAAGATLPGLSDLTRYQSAMNDALTAGQSAMGVDASDISKFYDPYQQEVIDEMQRQSDINLQRNVMPALRALGVGISGGAAGNRRTFDISGQALADVASGLQAQQTAARSAGFKQALDAALREQGQQSSTASALSSLGTAEQNAATAGIKSLADAGAAKLAYDQSKIEAPLTRALNVNKIMQGYQYPTTVSETKEEIPTTMSSSPLTQIAGLSSLLASGTQSESGWLNKIINSIFKGVETRFPEISYPDAPIVDRSEG